MKANELNIKFDEGDDILSCLDLFKAKRTRQEQNVYFPAWMIESLDKEANRIGVARQSIIKIWLAERLEGLTTHNSLKHTNR